jgi:hypothetical protein
MTAYGLKGGTMGLRESVGAAGEPDDVKRTTVSRWWGTRWINIAVSGAALLASVVSLWETTLKRPDVKVYVLHAGPLGRL